MKLRKILLIYVILLLLVACKQEDNQNKIKPKDKAPESLNSISKGIDDILKIVGDIEKLTLNIPLGLSGKEEAKKARSQEGQQQGQDGGQSSKNSESKKEASSNGESKGGSSGTTEDKQGKENQDAKDNKALTPDKKKEEMDKKWNEAQIKLEEIHPHWNSFEAEGQKKGLSRESADGFEVSLNKMTKALENRNIVEIYDFSSQALLRLKPIYDLYTEDFGGDVAAIKYAAYQAYVRAQMGDIEGASRVLTDRDENVNRIRLKVKEDKKEKVEKVNLSLVDFKQSLVERSRSLFMIKKDIVINNLKELEK